MSDSVYFAAKDADKTSAILLAKANTWYNQLHSNGYLMKVQDMWAAYHGAFYSSSGNGHKITFSGEQGELVNIAVNHIRNIGQHMIRMITANRPALQARAANKDYKSLVQTKLANELLDYYLREKRLEKYLERAVEYAVVFGTGFIKMEWNATTGEIYEVNEETGAPIYEGDVQFANLSPYDVVFDMTKEDQNHDWILCRTWKSKFDLAAKYPEMGNKIKGLPTKSDFYQYRFDMMSYEETDDIPVYEFYHKKTEALPDGRYLLFLGGDLVLMDSPMPYRQLPVYRISPSDILGTPYGYTPLFDLLPIQDAVNSLYSTILTNQHAFGVQNIYIPRGADVTFKSLSGGLNIVEGNSQAGKPEALNLTQTPAEIFNFLKILETQMETISGINSVSRGNPEASLKSGAALALVQSMSLQFMSGLQSQYVQMLEDVGTGLINMLKDFASVPRIAMIAGKSNRSYVEHEFSGDDLGQVNRVIVDVGNPLSRCLAKGTEVLMHDGSKRKVEDIIIGDLIMGPDSRPRTVSNVNSGTEMMYEVTSKNSKRQVKYGANESHILTLKYCSDDIRYNAKKGQIKDITINDYLKLTAREKNLLQGFKTGVEFKEKQLTIPPYILGSWIGDGSRCDTSITTMDSEVFKAWFDYAESIGMQLRTSTSKNSGQAKTYYVTSGEQNGSSGRNLMLNELRAMEVYKNKHIPECYLKNNRQNRLELLAGLIDTDGTRIDETYVFTQKDDRISNQVVFLAESLGFRVTHVRVKNASSELVGEVTGNVNKITLGGNTWEIPTRIERKKCSPKFKVRDWLNYGINVTAVGEGTYYGFTLKEEPHFILGDFTVTHNTTAGKVQLAESLIQYGIVETPEQYFQVLTTGRLDVMTDDAERELLLIEGENERMAEGREAHALVIDQHRMHIKMHKTLLADPDLRDDEQLAGKVLAHIQEHIDMLRNTDPGTLSVVGEEPLGPVGGSAPAPGPGQDAPNNSQAPNMQDGPITDPNAPPAPPGIPPLPQVPAEALPNAELQAQAMNNVKQ